MDAPARTEGAELRLRTTGPLPPGAVEDIRRLIAVARRPRGLTLRGGQAIKAVRDPVVASTFALADADLDAVFAEFVHHKAARDAAPPPPDVAGQAVAAAEANLRAAAEAAAAAGVVFRLRVPVESPVV